MLLHIMALSREEAAEYCMESNAGMWLNLSPKLRRLRSLCMVWSTTWASPDGMLRWSGNAICRRAAFLATVDDVVTVLHAE